MKYHACSADSVLLQEQKAFNTPVASKLVGTICISRVLAEIKDKPARRGPDIRPFQSLSAHEHTLAKALFTQDKSYNYLTVTPLNR